ncbi:MAG: IS200/IS605 family element transposase accessory protein TnpB [Armatimonadetes bacterium]|nr:IS200/IS605 family element transposase accessory protein TnpB [Armatimonadota bacterium]
MTYLTYTFKLLQTKGKKGKMLHEAMRRWSVAQTEFLDSCRNRVEELTAACVKETERGQRTDNGALKKWVAANLHEMNSFQQLENSVGASLEIHLAAQLHSFLELRRVQQNTGFPTGRNYADADFDAYVDSLTTRAWVDPEDTSEEQTELEYATIAGKVQGYRPKHTYTPIEFCRYDSANKHRNYKLLKSEDGTLFALLYLLPADTRGSRPTKGDLREIVSGHIQKSISNKAALFPLATSKWVLRKLEHYKPRPARLVYRVGDFYLHVPVDVPEAEQHEALTLMGVDLGKNRTASIGLTTLDGKDVIFKRSFRTLHASKVRDITAKTAKAQAKGKYVYRKYRRTNEEAAHTTANEILAWARRYKSKIVLEDLSSLMKANVAPGKSSFNKGRKSNIYASIREALEYKARIQGIEVVFVHPGQTSQTCPKCGCIDKNNRLKHNPISGRISRESFQCISCGYSDGDADAVAAVNIARKWVFTQCRIEQRKQGSRLSWPDFAREICSG